VLWCRFLLSGPLACVLANIPAQSIKYGPLPLQGKLTCTKERTPSELPACAVLAFGPSGRTLVGARAATLYVADLETGTVRTLHHHRPDERAAGRLLGGGEWPKGQHKANEGTHDAQRSPPPAVPPDGTRAITWGYAASVHSESL